MKVLRSSKIVWLLTLLLVFQMFAGFLPDYTYVKAEERVVRVVGSFGSDGDPTYWNPASDEFEMTAAENGMYYLKKILPAGTYEYKIAINGSWNENYGANGERGGSNITFTLNEEKEVLFVYNDQSHIVTTMTEDKLPRIVGSLQPAIGGGDEWSPGTSTAILTDENYDNVYEYTTNIPKGDYEFKIVLGNAWGVEYPASNVALNVTSTQQVTFYYNHETKRVSTNYEATGPDGLIKTDKLHHNTWKELYRKPFGAVKAGEEVTIRLEAAKGDLTSAKVLLKNYTTGNSELIKMNQAGWTEIEGKGEVEYWKAAFTPEDKGVYGYKFIAYDGKAVKEYGEDTAQGKTGHAGDKVLDLFQLTVFDPDYKTPDWMKEAVVYQIFPDRFYNGNPDNDDAKNHARGDEPIEHQEWEQLPDNPRLQNSGNYNGDGIWSNDFFGGDIKGVHEKLDYIQSLGVNTIYLNPVAHASSNHKYDATDYTSIDPMFGSPKEFKKFTHELKKREMHLILDGVFNHVGDDSIYFDRYGKYETVGAYEYWARIYDLINKEGLSEETAKAQAEKEFIAEGQVFSDYGFHNWFNIENKKVDVGTETERYSYQAWWGFDSLPEIASIPGEVAPYDSELNNEQFANYIMYDKDSVAKSWLKRGGSGWRLDVANEVDPQFWREFRDEIKNTKTKTMDDPLILGEIWDDASKYFLGDLYDSVMNYRFRGAVIDYLKNGDSEGAADQLTAIQEDYPKEAFYNLMNLMGSHDTARAVFILGNGTDSAERAEFDQNYDHELGINRLKLAATFQFGYPGAPTVYYGDEAGVTGSKDPDDRRTYPWGSENDKLIGHYQTLGKVREQHQDLFAHGDLVNLLAEDDMLVYGRSTDHQYGLVAINRGTEDKTVQIDVSEFVLNGVSFTDQLDKSYKIKIKDGIATLIIPAMSGRMLVTDQVEINVPSAVEAVNVEEGVGEVRLSWSGDTAAYNVYVSTIEGALYQKVETTSDTSLTIDGLDNGRNYYFAVTSVDELGNESVKTAAEAVIPHIPLSEGSYTIESMTEFEPSVLDLSKPKTVEAAISIGEYTNDGLAEGLKSMLQYKAEGAEDWNMVAADYVRQGDQSNVFSARFSPLETGIYQYRYAFSTDLGRSWVYSKTNAASIVKAEDETPPADTVTLVQPVQESGQVNLEWSFENPVDPYMIAIVRDRVVIEKIWDPEATRYPDLRVENGTTYTYSVKVFDQFGNAVESNPVTVTPDIVMIEVTFKVHAPEYTKLDAKITMPNSMNGWNTGAWEMSRNGAVTTDWEYTVEMQVGEVLTYKYARDGSWDKEGLADHTPYDATDDDISYYGYGAPGTDLKVIVENQGNNKMVIEDTILRWVDLPVVVTSHTNGQSVTADTVKLSGNAIKEGILTINGEQVQINDDMSWSHEVNLVGGENHFNIHIEPSEENKSTIFNNDSGAISKNTKGLTFTLVKN
ncbi:alpha-amylase family glycosyl hydrolase [Alkalihalobacillus sp. AL-G]|uniref:alpha-amylase family glycosyl hydrolase n=1 Tax=Alkalihalobacillus sp. AL-G TaxID=2926399 RepID=UPI0027296F7E|nr:alpha-amylase family glycosyl hydrolase [Alkalihalobacillus sp. AL-G]WLD92769.1 alpha-amylase family glycosyl hydrolase [Alkalihalobacillus sp. AL-G]